MKNFDFLLKILKEEGLYRSLLCIYMVIIYCCATLYMQSYPHIACISS